MHWGVTSLGGLTAIGFLAATPSWRLPILFVPVLVQLAWLWFVIARTKKSHLTDW